MLNLIWMAVILINIGISVYRRNLELTIAWVVAALALSLQFL